MDDLIKSDLNEEVEADVDKATVRRTLIRGLDDAYHTWLLAGILPWARIEGRPPSGTGKHPPPIAATVAREGLKADNKILRIIQGALIHTAEIAAFKNMVVQGQAEGESMTVGPSRDVLGMAIRRWGQDWRMHAMLALLLELGEAQDNRIGRSLSPTL